MKTLLTLTVTLALLTSAVQAQEPTLTLSNGKVFNAAMVEGMANTLESMVKLDKLSGAVRLGPDVLPKSRKYGARSSALVSIYRGGALGGWALLAPLISPRARSV